MKVTKSMAGGQGASRGSGGVPRGNFSSSNVQGSRLNEGAESKFRTGKKSGGGKKMGRQKY